MAAVRAVLETTGVAPENIDELIFGNARQAGVGPNLARQVLHGSGIPDKISAYTVNKACGSGLQAIINAAQLIQLEEAVCVVAGGTESMSNTPYLLPGARWGYRLGHGELVDGMYRDGFLCQLCGLLMGETAEKLAKQYAITRPEQDQFAVESQQKCQRARHEDRFNAEIVPVEVGAGTKRAQTVKEDEYPRDNVSLESLKKLPPVFEK